ncbi:phosphoglycerate mutase [Komagataeibacter rhaeticus]|uniref:histidine phosphatase family protein n=1 Tax=Komagataeibacter rhaeticus TaxID=215221 RepID=UPI0004D997AB|nr:histidine phosphatase family protein [Komagataeibacter rhaeticus]KDU94806.1 phosphoglycerate mutase [Komagataeibacter rhaeticus AF1]MBL7240333.1 histidine phosphatase family protein [Komagataeibacter rhaeticus]PYD55066.1 phosphoglycerate mutase [Komagataeibacter rhaeticus]GBQ11997.1 phosphoglycerate mutase [Komagataeibacter rhaeticus DSM 16663]
MNQILTCLALPAPDSLRRGVFPDPDAPVTLPPATGRALSAAQLALVPPALLPACPSARPDASLNGVDMGAWRGMPLKDVPPTDLARWVTDPGFAPPGGQSRAAHLGHMRAWLAGLPRTPAHLCVAADAAVIRAIVVAALGGTPAMLSKLDIAPPSTTRLTRHTGWRVAVAGAPLS